MRGLFLEGPIFRGAYVRREIWVSKSIGLACSGKEIYHFSFVLLCIRGQIASTSPPWGAYIRRGNLAEGFLRYDLGGLYLEGLVHGGAYFRNFTINHIIRTTEMKSNELECLEQAILLQGLVLLELKGLRIISELD